MKKIYEDIWNLAKPYYLKGRNNDIFQIEWMIDKVENMNYATSLDTLLLMPLIILHDTGYSKIDSNNPNIKSKDVKLTHMREGALIAQDILNQVNYNPILTDLIVYYVSVHDNWIFGDDSPYEKKEMAFFNDLDFMWPLTSFDTFKNVGESMNLNPNQFYNLMLNDEKLIRRPFCCEETKKLFELYMKNVNKELNKLINQQIQ